MGKSTFLGTRVLCCQCFSFNTNHHVHSETCSGCLCRWHHSQERGEGARGVTVVLGREGMELLLLHLRRLALDGLPAAFPPLTAAPSEPQLLMSANFRESFPLLILFFPGVLTDLWTTQYPLFTVLQCQTPQSVYITGFILLNLKVWGSGSWRCYFEGQEVHLKEKGMLPHLFFRFTLPLL